jgi:hypothetical protein
MNSSNYGCLFKYEQEYNIASVCENGGLAPRRDLSELLRRVKTGCYM